MSIISDSYIRWSPYCIWDEFDNNRKIAVLRLTKINRGEGIYTQFDEVTSELWRLFNGTKNVDSILKKFIHTDKYKLWIDENLILKVLEEFLSIGLIKLSNIYHEITHIKWKGHECVNQLNFIDWYLDNKTLVILNNSNGFLVELSQEYYTIWCKINNSNTVDEIMYKLTAKKRNDTFKHIRLQLRYLNDIGIISVM